ncbi:prothymosin alpha-A-like [Chiloscyllium plagiosum]|uniref:prothymosin alpha-A-like n=1 Tax=Chiloscyllium plagiosum TaxID=36176 RepID=UPI001CB7FABA|nr:prothymosin alpha-A-like [Chiloscyllium plagiosum]
MMAACRGGGEGGPMERRAGAGRSNGTARRLSRARELAPGGGCCVNARAAAASPALATRAIFVLFPQRLGAQPGTSSSSSRTQHSTSMSDSKVEFNVDRSPKDLKKTQEVEPENGKGDAPANGNAGNEENGEEVEENADEVDEESEDVGEDDEEEEDDEDEEGDDDECEGAAQKRVAEDEEDDVAKKKQKTDDE